MWNQIFGTLEDSMERVLSRLAALLPGVFAFLLAVVIFVLIGWGLAWSMRKVLSAIHFDKRVGTGGERLSEWSPHQTPTSLVGAVVFWVTVVIGVAIGLEAFGATSNELIAVGILSYLPQLVGAVVILLIGNVIARVLARGVLIGGVNMNLQYARLLSLGIKWLVLVLTAAMALDHLRIAQGIVDLAFGILFGGIVLALALSVGLGSRDLVSRSLDRESARSMVQPSPLAEERLRHF